MLWLASAAASRRDCRVCSRSCACGKGTNMYVLELLR